MNKKTIRIAGWALGLSMAVAGIGAAVGTSAFNAKNEPLMVKADTATITATFDSFGLTGSLASGTETSTGYQLVVSSGTSTNGVAKNATITNTISLPGSITNVTINGAVTMSSKTDGSFTVHGGVSSDAITTSMGSATGLSSTSKTCSIDFTGECTFFKITVGSARTLKFTNIVVTYNKPVASYKVTYNGNGNTGGSVPIDNTNYSLDGSGICTVLGNVNSLTKTHYSFAGWNTSADGKGTSRNADDTFPVTANTTLFAQWVSSEVWLSTASGDVGKGSNLDISSYVNGATGTVSYSSSNDGIATVSSDGVISGVSAGNATITVSDSGTSTSTTFALTVKEFDNDYSIVSGGAYKIHHTKKDTTDVYYPKSKGEDGVPLATLNAWESTVFNFVLMGDNEFYIMSGDDYLYTNNSNDGLRIGSTKQSWLLSGPTAGKSGAYTIMNQSHNRYLCIYSTQDFRTYTSATATNRTENSDLTVYTDAEFSSDVLNATNTICSEGYDNVKTDFDDMWGILTSDYNALVGSDKSDFSEATANYSGTDLQKAAARYDYLVAKYGLTDFAGREPEAIGGAAYVTFASNLDTNLPLIITLVSGGILLTGGAFLFARRHKNED